MLPYAIRSERKPRLNFGLRNNCPVVSTRCARNITGVGSSRFGTPQVWSKENRQTVSLPADSRTLADISRGDDTPRGSVEFDWNLMVELSGARNTPPQLVIWLT